MYALKSAFTRLRWGSLGGAVDLAVYQQHLYIAAVHIAVVPVLLHGEIEIAFCGASVSCKWTSLKSCQVGVELLSSARLRKGNDHLRHSSRFSLPHLL